MALGERIEKLPPQKPGVQFTIARKLAFLELFRNHDTMGGRKYLCAEAVGVSMSTVSYHYQYDPEFKQQMDEAQQGWIDENLFTPAFDRATRGVKRPIVGGRERDTIVAYITEYSDSLMLAMLRAHRSEFKDKEVSGVAGGGSNGTGGVMIVPASPGTTAEWETMYGEKARGTTGLPGEGEE